MRLYGVRGFPAEAEVPTIVLQVRANAPERVVQLAGARPIAVDLRLEAVDIGCALPTEGVRYEGPWPWLGEVIWAPCPTKAGQVRASAVSPTLAPSTPATKLPPF